MKRLNPWQAEEFASLRLLNKIYDSVYTFEHSFFYRLSLQLKLLKLYFFEKIRRAVNNKPESL